MNYRFQFKLFGKSLRFTKLFDDISRYDYQYGNGSQNMEHWHRLGFGFYIKSDRWF
jgi:hypothetical protein